MVGPSAVGPSAGSHSNATANNAKQIAKYPKYKKPRPFPNPPWRRAHDNAYAPCSPLKLSARRVAPLLHSRISPEAGLFGGARNRIAAQTLILSPGWAG
jgi:hypothetical protein